MPLYEFRCPEGHEFEKFYRSIGGAESTAVCPVCGERAERMMSAAGFAFKGSGFYLTDYGKNAHRGEAPPDNKPAAASSDTASSSEKSEGAKSESNSSSSDSAKAESSKAESSKAGESAKPAPEAKKTESKSTEAKPASTPKPSAGE
jgi:putative FmdB family regulatory protein